MQETVTGLAFQKVVTRKDFKNHRVSPVSVERLQKARELSLGFYFFFARGRYVRPMVVEGVLLMGMIMIRCPKTGQAISTGRNVEPAIFRSSPVFFSRTYCPLCRSMHEWFARDAWVRETSGLECETIREGQVALDRMRKFLPIALVLAAFITADAATACVRTIHHQAPDEPRLLYLQEDLQGGPCHMARPYNGRPVPDCAD